MGCTFEDQRITSLCVARRDPTPEAYFLFPVLVVSAPLWTFDLRKPDSLTPVDSLLVNVAVDTVYGVVHALVDIVRESAIDDLLLRYTRVQNGLEKALPTLAPTLATEAKRQRDDYLKSLLERS